jgi:hypothetical protein
MVTSGPGERAVKKTHYDTISQDYKESKLLPWRDHVE